MKQFIKRQRKLKACIVDRYAKAEHLIDTCWRFVDEEDSDRI
ncbi:hypothetical protein [Staphylococcus coagulans]|nr:hypothetical protein [Staphylococcus coagulans]MDR9833484.1 hypothetical protein [Staphylococcus coagulans]